MIKLTTATKKLAKLRKRIRCVQGGTSASKTFSILLLLIDKAQSNKNLAIDVASQTFPHLESGAIKDFKVIMQAQNYWDDSRWNETKHFYTFETGTVIKFIAIDNIGKAKGPRRDILFLNEANHLEWEVVDQMIARTKGDVWIDWNPSSEFWFHDEIKDKIDHDFIILNYLDNEALDQTIIDYIESKRHNALWWKVYGLGKLGTVEGRIYTNWKGIDQIPHEARLVRTGLDFGYSVDPTAIVDVYEYNGGYILNEIRYAKKQSNEDLAKFLSAREEQALVIADSAEPKSIDEIATYDVDIVGCTKGPGSIARGINFVQSKPIWVTMRSRNLLKEYKRYVWKVDPRTGVVLSVPEATPDHALDAVRYALDSLEVNDGGIKEQQAQLLARNRNRAKMNTTR